MVIYYCFTNHPQTQQLKITTVTSFYLSQFWWLTGQFRVFYEIAVRYSSQGWAHLKACFIHMSDIWAEKIFLKSWGMEQLGLSLLCVVSPYSLSLWCSQTTQISYVAEESQSQHPNRNQQNFMSFFYNLALEFGWLHFHCVSFTEAVTQALPSSREIVKLTGPGPSAPELASMAVGKGLHCSLAGGARPQLLAPWSSPQGFLSVLLTWQFLGFSQSS